MRNIFFHRSYLSIALMAALLPASWAQQSLRDRDTQEPQLSRAEQEADRLVSLSAEKIIELLRDEPGLLLQVKKMLVRKAFEQGRILEAQDLTDDALFRLLREDGNIRVLATQEIEDRYYVRPKPTREELHQQEALAAQRGLWPAGQTANTPVKPDATNQNLRPTSQEELYWQNRSGYPLPSYTPQPQALPPLLPAPQPEESLPRNPNRQVQRVGLQQRDPYRDQDDGYDGFGSASLPRVTPDQLSSLLSVNAPYPGPSMPANAGRGTNSPDPSSGFNPGNLSASTGMGFDNDAGAALPPSSSALPAFPGQTFSMPNERRTEYSQPAAPGNNLQASLQGPWRRPTELNQDRPLIRRRPNPYADVPSLYDLYAQVSRRPAELERFGVAIFRNGTGNLDSLPMDLPAGPDYVLGPGDGLSIDLWGGVSQRLQRVVDRQGQVALPEVGTVLVAGRTLGDVQRMVQSVLRTQFRDVAADVSLGRIRSVRIYVVGDVASPGAYDISSLSTPLNAIYAAGGPTSRGSLRHLRHYRGNQLVEEIDAYDLLLRGVHSDMARLQSGDTILVPPLGPEVTVEGMVRRPAIYELGREKSLADALELSGGVLPTGTLRHVDVERTVAHEKRTMLRLDIPESNDAQAVNQALEEFQVQDGDRIRISPILPYADQTVYLDGHVFHPGKYPYRDGMKVTDLVHAYSDLLPEPSQRHAEIIRLQPPDFTPQVLAFNLGDALSGKNADLVLKPFDTVRIYGRYDFEDAPLITVSGEVRDPGDHITNGVTHLRDVVYLAGGLTPDAQTGDAQIFRRMQDGKLKVLSVNLGKALAGDTADNLLLQPKDRVLIQRNSSKTDPPTVQVQGQVLNPGRYPLGEGMTASDLVRMAGGFKRGADTAVADLTTYTEHDEQNRIGEHRNVPLAEAMAGLADADVALHDGDVLAIRQVPGWSDRGAAITLKGEVVHPGTYGLREGERMSSLLARAGGLRSDAYPYGAILERVQIREIQEKDRADLLRRVQAEGNSLRQAPENDNDQKLTKQAAILQWQATIDQLQSTPPSGRLVIHISKDLKNWTNTSSDLELRAGDILTIPKTPNFAMVSGAVYNPTAVAYRSGKNAGWYLRQAGGANTLADKSGIFLIRADGSVVGGKGGLWNGGALDAEVRPGDVLVVPEKAFNANSRWKSVLQTSQLVSAVGIAIQVARGF
ncbi:MAG: SLBB domain-containing protein [Acidobacteria bacterium]|nr:SLBB domain-containing protein [Acidobacteriota bacterium]